MGKRVSLIAILFFTLANRVISDPPAFDSRTVLDAGELRHWPCQPTVADLNNDGKKDLILGTWCMERIVWYENFGTDAVPVFGHAQYLVSKHDIPDNIWHDACPLMADWNGDGLLDLLAGISSSRVLLFLNQGTSEEPYFDADYSFLMEGGDTLIAETINPAPYVVDWDGDGVRDLILSKAGHGHANAKFYRNIGTDNDPILALVDTLYRLWGSDTIPVSTGFAIPVDWNNDGVMDLITTDYGSYLKLFLRSAEYPVNYVGSYTFLTAGGEQIPTAEDAILCEGLRPWVVDWNSDGKKDLIMGTIDETGVIFYENIGSDSSPILDSGVVSITGKDFGTGNFLFRPYYVDWDSDGKRDLIVGSADNYESGGYIDVYYNSGSEEVPVFTTKRHLYVGDNPIKVDGTQWYARSSPYIVDWNSDGAMDLISGSYAGMVYVYINTSVSDTPAFAVEDTVYDGGSYLNIGTASVPVMVDWDNDGLKDLITGGGNGRVYFCKNYGTTDQPAFSGCDTISNIDVGENASPWVVDLDGDGKKDLIIGSRWGYVYFCKNVGTDSSPYFEGYVPLQDAMGDIHFGYGFTSPVITDWNGDAVYDLLVGEEQLYIYLGRATDIATDYSKFVTDGRVLQNFPNPFSRETWIPFTLDKDCRVSIGIYDLSGRCINRIQLGFKHSGYYLGKSKAARWDCRDERGELVPSGVYFYRIDGDHHSRTLTNKMMIIIK